MSFFLGYIRKVTVKVKFNYNCVSTVIFVQNNVIKYNTQNPYT